MSWNSAEAPINRLRYSISARLTLLYTMTSFVAAAVFTGILYSLLVGNFNSEHLDFMRSKAKELAADFRDDRDNPQALLTEISKETSGIGQPEYRARVIAQNGKQLGATAGMDRTLPASAFPAAVLPDDMDRHLIRDRYDSGDHYILATFRFAVPGVLDRAYNVQMALDVTRDDNLLADYRRGLMLFLALLVPILIIAGYLVTRHGLRPLERIARAAKSVTAERLSQRIPLYPPWPPELEQVAGVFNDMMDRLEDAFTRLSRFSADLAHELRTPLNNLMGELEVCLSRDRDVVEYRKALASNLEECRRLTLLIENLLFIARMSASRVPPGSARFDAREMLEGLLANHASGAGKPGVALEYEGDATIYADPILFRQAVSNLLANAIRHSPPGGTVWVTARETGEGVIEVTVADKGDGIDAEHLEHIFDRFYQADPSRSPRGQGTGLGLSIVRSIMTLHGGTVSIDSEPGRGTVATLSFPSGEGSALSQR